LLTAPVIVTAQVLDPANCWSVITSLTDIRSRSELVLTETPAVGAIVKSVYNGIEHYSLSVGQFAGGEMMIYECGKGLGNDPKPGKGGCGFRILGSSPNEVVQ